MIIIFIIASLEDFGGTERVATLLANGLVDRHQITILSRKSLKNSYGLSSKIKDIKFSGNNFKFLRQCKQYIDETKPDRVIVHTMSKLTPAIILAGINAESLWSLEHISFEFHSWFFKQLRKRLYNRVDKVITLTKNDAVNYRRFHKDVTVIANATPLTILKKPINNNSKIIISIGRLTHQKGYDFLINAWSSIEQHYPDWSLHIYGEGEDRRKLEKIIRNRNLNNIVLKGLTNDVQSVYDNAAFYVMSSRFEGFGMVLIEAQSRGLPIISFDCPSGPAEIIHHDMDGYLVESGNIKALTAKISHLIENQSTRAKFSDNSLISAQRFQSEHIIIQWNNIINHKDHQND